MGLKNSDSVSILNVEIDRSSEHATISMSTSSAFEDTISTVITFYIICLSASTSYAPQVELGAAIDPVEIVVRAWFRTGVFVKPIEVESLSSRARP